MKVKGIRKVRLNQNMRETSRAGILAHSAGNNWWSAHLSREECSGPNQCGRVRAVTDRAGGPCVMVGSGVLGIEPGSEKAQVSFEKEGKRRITAMGSYWTAVMGKTALLVPFRGEKTGNSDKTSREKRETNRQLGDPICGGTWLFPVEFVCEIKSMDTRQKDKEKETAPGDRNPKLRDIEAQILGLGRIKELVKVHGFGRTDHDQDPYVLGRIFGFLLWESFSYEIS
ncbi:hypothetical protein F2Q69_00022497 [Brassica cretica]|uniref:Uncharacterized protein n=1 Tax=Brassica cretica TaxID=69181 RepID=A0A8S9QB38_BRACR|nr:hypothetical protein F2Q69_00022497 [Brassica cretica]